MQAMKRPAEEPGNRIDPGDDAGGEAPEKELGNRNQLRARYRRRVT